MDPEFSLFKAEMKKLIERQYNLHGEKKVVVISHSFAGPLFRMFLSTQTQEWKDKYIKSWLSINGAFAGSVKAVHAITTGHVGYDWLPIQGKRFISSIMATFPASIKLQSSIAYFGLDRVYSRRVM